jgi:peptidoglycan/xylan/chitin deacetylase (PgdA/CDA1 family)
MWVQLSGMPFRSGLRDLAMESQYEYGTRAGVWRLARMFEEKKIRITVYAVGQSILKSTEAAKNLVRCGHEFTSHGYRWIDHHTMPLAVEKVQIEKAIDAIEKTAGTPPKGWFLGRPSVSTKGLVCQVFKERGLELLYSSDAYADDLPWWEAHPFEKGKGLLIIPHSLVGIVFILSLYLAFCTHQRADT